GDPHLLRLRPPSLFKIARAGGPLLVIIENMLSRFFHSSRETMRRRISRRPVLIGSKASFKKTDRPDGFPCLDHQSAPRSARSRLAGNAFAVALAAGSALSLWACASAPPATPGRAPRGSLLIVGGGPIPDAIIERFVALAGGPGRARIVIFPMASESEDA